MYWLLLLLLEWIRTRGCGGVLLRERSLMQRASGLVSDWGLQKQISAALWASARVGTFTFTLNTRRPISEVAKWHV